MLTVRFRKRFSDSHPTIKEPPILSDRNIKSSTSSLPLPGSESNQDIQYDLLAEEVHRELGYTKVSTTFRLLVFVCLFVCSGFFRNSNMSLFFSWCTILSFMQSECHGPKTYENDTSRGATSPRDYGGIPGHFHSCGKSKLFSHFISHRFFVVALWHDDHGWHLWSLLLCTWHHFTR